MYFSQNFEVKKLMHEYPQVSGTEEVSLFDGRVGTFLYITIPLCQILKNFFHPQYVQVTF